MQFKKFEGATLLLAACLLVVTPQIGFAECGDFDGDGMLSVSDITGLYEYLVNAGPTPNDYDSADFDLYDKLTFNDLAHMWACLPLCDFTDEFCPPTEPPLDPAVDPDFKVKYPESIPVGFTSYEIELVADATVESQAICLPLKLRIDGTVPQIDSVVVSDESSYLEIYGTGPVRYNAVLNSDSGLVIVSGAKFNTAGVTKDPLATVYVTVPEQTYQQPIDLQFVELTPDQAVTGEENAVFPMYAPAGFFSLGHPTREPVLESHCCTLGGDVDGNGRVNISDVVKIICVIFGGCDPNSICVEALDADGDGSPAISDAVFIINYIFGGGPAPLCTP